MNYSITLREYKKCLIRSNFLKKIILLPHPKQDSLKMLVFPIFFIIYSFSSGKKLIHVTKVTIHTYTCFQAYQDQNDAK